MSDIFKTVSKNLLENSSGYSLQPFGYDNREENFTDLTDENVDDRLIHLYFTRIEDLPELDATEDLMAKISAMSRRVIMCTSWAELPEMLKLNPQSICFNYKEIDHSSAVDIVSMVRTMSKLINLPYKIKVSVDVGKNTPLSLIKLLQKSNIQGIVPRPCDFGWNECEKGCEDIWAGISYWPEHILYQLPNPAEPLLNIFFREDWKDHITKFDLKEFQNTVAMNVVMCSDWDELDHALAKKPHQLVLHITMLKRLGLTISEIMSMLETKMKLTDLDIPVAVGIDLDTPAAVIKELKRAGVHGIIPAAGSWSVKETVAGIHALRDRIPYWPKHILEQLSDDRKKKQKTNGISLTSRQQQILDIVATRGTGNKTIAKILNISESTVKLHVGCLLKKFGVKNRTQLAVFARSHTTS